MSFSIDFSSFAFSTTELKEGEKLTSVSGEKPLKGPRSFMILSYSSGRGTLCSLFSFGARQPTGNKTEEGARKSALGSCKERGELESPFPSLSFVLPSPLLPVVYRKRDGRERERAELTVYTSTNDRTLLEGSSLDSSSCTPRLPRRNPCSAWPSCPPIRAWRTGSTDG